MTLRVPFCPFYISPFYNFMVWKERETNSVNKIVWSFVQIVIGWFEEMTLRVPLFVQPPSYLILPWKQQEICIFFWFFFIFIGLLFLWRMFRTQKIEKCRNPKRKSNDRWPLDYPTYPRQQFLSKEAPTAILAAKISGMKLNLASCRITTVISCCLDKIATKLCHNASKWSLKWPVNIVERRRIIPEFKLEENWAKIIGLFVRILAGDRGCIISKLYILHLISGWLKILHFQMSV